MSNTKNLIREQFNTIAEPVQQVTNQFIDHPLEQLIYYLQSLLSTILNYQVFITENNKPILISTILGSLFFIIIGIKISKKISLIVKRKIINGPEMDMNIAHFFERITFYGFSLVFVLLVFAMFNVPLTTFAVIGTTIAFGLGLGSQHIANNFLSGLILLTERPIKLEDKVEVDGVSGTVINVGTRCTTILTDDNCSILVPNSGLMQEIVINYSNKKIKAVLNVQIENQITMVEIDQEILKAISSLPNILNNPPVRILYKKITKDFYDINIEFYFSSSSKYKDNVDMAIDDLNRVLMPMLQSYAILIDPEKLEDKDLPKENKPTKKLVDEESAVEKLF